VSATDPRAFDKIVDFVDRRRAWCFAGVIGLLALGFNGQWRIEPDGALYLSLARSLAEGLGYTYHGEPHGLAFPGLPYLVAGTFKLFGAGGLIPIHLIIWLCAAGALGLTYRLMRLHTDRPTAVIVTLLTGISYTFYGFAFQLRNDMPFLLGVLGVLCGWEALCRRRINWIDLTLLVAGLTLAIVMRPAMWALVGAVLIAVIVRVAAKRNAIQAILLGTAVVGAAAVFLWIDPRASARFAGDYEVQTVGTLGEGFAPTFQQVVMQNLPQMFGPIAAETLFGHEAGPVLNQLFGVFIIAASLALLYRRALWGLLMLLTVLMMLRFLPRDAILPRYFLPVFPLMVLATWNGLRWLNDRLPRPWDWLAVAILGFWITTNGLKIGELIIEQRRTPFYAHYKEARYAPLLQIAREIELKVEPNQMVLAEAKVGRILSYFSRRTVVDTWEVPELNPYPFIYVLKPIDRPLKKLMDQYDLVFYRPPIARVPIPGAGNDGAYELRYAVIKHAQNPNDTWESP